jgi:DUF1680 family protein
MSISKTYLRKTGLSNNMEHSKKYFLLGLLTICFLQLKNKVLSQSNHTNPFQKIKSISTALQTLPFNAVQPSGWLKMELQKNLNGFTGHLDSLVPDLILNDAIYGAKRLSKQVKSKNLGAISADGDWQVQFLWWNSETQCNWLDGYIRTSILLNDKNHIAKAGKIVDALLATQDKDGYLGIYDPELRYKFDNENGELWAKTTLLRAILGWYEYKKDPHVLLAIERAVENVMKAYPIDQSSPFHTINPNAGGLTHGLAFTDVLEQLAKITRKKHYIDYCLFLYKDFSKQVINEDAQYAKLIDPSISLMGHGVHTFEHLRSVVAAYYASGNPALKMALNSFLKKIELVSTPSGGPVGDEFIGGRKGNGLLGYEFCSLHELMTGWIDLLEKSSDNQYAEKAEQIFFNAALGNTHPTQSAICYLKQDNSFQLTGGNNGDTTDKHQTRYRYSPVHKEAAVCCIPNAGRIVPYFIQNMWMKEGQDLVATLLGPSVLNTTLSNTPIIITETTEYPFENNIAFQITAKSHIRFSLKIRKPQWAIAVKSSLPYKEVNGYLVFDQVWNQSTKLEIDFTSEISKKFTADKEVYFQNGPLVLCHEINATQKITRIYPIAGLFESSYQATQPVTYTYEKGEFKAMTKNTCSVWMTNPTTGKQELLVLKPMARTILRQVSFKTIP